MFKEGLFESENDKIKILDIKEKDLEGIFSKETNIIEKVKELEEEGFFELGPEFEPEKNDPELKIPDGLNVENFGIQNFNESLDEIDLEGMELDEYKERLKEETSWSDEIINGITSIEEGEIYRRAGLIEEDINGRACLVKEDIDLDTPVDDPLNRTNRERMEQGLCPIDESGEKIELHHIGQKSDGPLVELTQSEHRGKGSDGILHDKNKESEINRNQFNNEKSEHWNTRVEEV